VFLPRLKSRERFGLINVSSGTGWHAMPYATTYSSSKTFVNYFTQGIKAENQNQDIMLLTPGFTSTAMVRGFSAFGAADTAENCCKASLRDMGQDKVTCGSWKAEIMEALMNLGSYWLPSQVFAFVKA